LVVSAIDTQWIGLIGALGGVVVTGLIGLATAVLNHRWQRASGREDRTHQAREAKAAIQRQAYARYLAAMEAVDTFLITRPPRPEIPVRDRLRANRQEDPKVFDEYDAAQAIAQLVAGDRVRDALGEFENQWTEACLAAVTADDPLEATSGLENTSKKEMIAAMRAEQAELLEPAGA
jgi:hypothetical protein